MYTPRGMPLISVALARRVFYRSENPYGPGHCWHCGTLLNLEQRTPGEGGWHVDHWPVCRRDIEQQWCWGVRNVREESNLVPSCIACNTSHRHERRYWYWGNRSQCPCTAPLLLGAAALLGTALSLWFIN